MPRPPKDDDATQNLPPEDETQRAKEGTKIGKLPKEKVMGDFKEGRPDAEPAYRTAAAQLQEEFAALPGPGHAVQLLEGLR